jgi:hypothetical protein
MNKEFISELKDFCNDHYEHFDCYPMEFEYNQRVYIFDQFMEWLANENLKGDKQ